MPQKYPQWSGGSAKREGTGFPIPSQKVQNMDFFLAEVALQQALESLAVSGLDIPRSEKYADFFCFKYV